MNESRISSSIRRGRIRSSRCSVADIGTVQDRGNNVRIAPEWGALVCTPGIGNCAMKFGGLGGSAGGGAVGGESAKKLDRKGAKNAKKSRSGWGVLPSSPPARAR